MPVPARVKGYLTMLAMLCMITSDVVRLVREQVSRVPVKEVIHSNLILGDNNVCLISGARQKFR